MCKFGFSKEMHSSDRLHLHPLKLSPCQGQFWNTTTNKSGSCSDLPFTWREMRTVHFVWACHLEALGLSCGYIWKANSVSFNWSCWLTGISSFLSLITYISSDVLFLCSGGWEVRSCRHEQFLLLPVSTASFFNTLEIPEHWKCLQFLKCMVRIEIA